MMLGHCDCEHGELFMSLHDWLMTSALDCLTNFVRKAPSKGGSNIFMQLGTQLQQMGNMHMAYSPLPLSRVINSQANVLCVAPSIVPHHQVLQCDKWEQCCLYGLGGFDEG